MLTEGDLNRAIGKCTSQIEDAMNKNREIDRKIQIIDDAISQAKAAQSIAKELKSKIKAVDLGSSWAGSHRESVEIYRDSLMPLYASNIINDIDKMITEMTLFRVNLVIQKNNFIAFISNLVDKAERLKNDLQDLVSNDSSCKA